MALIIPDEENELYFDDEEENLIDPDESLGDEEMEYDEEI